MSKNLDQILKKAKLKNIKKPDDTIPEKYIIIGASALAAYPSIIYKFKDMLINHKSVTKIKSSYKSEIIQSCINYSKTKDSSFNIRKKHHILELNESKLSNFLVLKLGALHNCVDNILYTCYYITTIDVGAEVIVALPQDHPNHPEAIKDNLDKHRMFDNKFELFGDFKLLYDFSTKFISYASSQDSSIRRFIPRNYSLVENEEYKEYTKRTELEKESEKIHSGSNNIVGSQTESVSTMVPHDEPFSTAILPNYNYEIDVYSYIAELFKLSNPKTMLFLFGFFLTNSIPECTENKNHNSLCLVTKDPDYAKKVCDILHRIVFKEEKLPAVHYDSSSKIKEYFEKCDHLPIILTSQDFNKSNRENLSHLLVHYYENKPNRLKKALVIISKKEIPCKYLRNIHLSSNNVAEVEKAIILLKSDTKFNDTINDFLRHLQSTYDDRSICIYDYEECKKNNAELIRRELSRKEQDLSFNYALTYEDSIAYSSVVYFVEKYFDFLLSAHGISEEQYSFLCRKLKELYSLCDEEIIDASEKVSEPTPEEISEILLQCVADAYMSGKVSTTKNDSYYIYTGCKEHKELLCFKHQKDSPMRFVIALIEEAGMQDKISNVKDFALREDIGEVIKSLWATAGLLHSKNGFLYTTRHGKVLALISEKLEAYFKN